MRMKRVVFILAVLCLAVGLHQVTYGRISPPANPQVQEYFSNIDTIVLSVYTVSKSLIPRTNIGKTYPVLAQDSMTVKVKKIFVEKIDENIKQSIDIKSTLDNDLGTKKLSDQNVLIIRYVIGSELIEIEGQTFLLGAISSHFKVNSLEKEVLNQVQIPYPPRPFVLKKGDESQALFDQALETSVGYTTSVINKFRTS